MAIQTVQAIINGQSYTLALNSATGKYEATITAPGKTSYNQSGGYYNVQIKATNDAGTVGSADASTLNGLKLYVKEKVAPVITILSPSSGAYVSNSKQPVVFTVTDETVDTVPPTLNVTSPTDNLVTASQSLTVAGITNDATSSPVEIKITLNGADQGDVTVGAGGAFSKAVTLAEGANTIVITATDAAVKVSTVTRNVTLDTSVPVIKSATITPNPVDAGATMVIAVEIE